MRHRSPRNSGFWLLCRYHILIFYVDSTDETKRLMLKVYNKKVIECIL